MSSWTRATLLMSSSWLARDVLHPADRLVGDAQRLEDLVVEALLAEQQRVHQAQEVAGLRALDDAVVVGAGQRDDLADRVAVERLGARALPLGGVLQRADADDRALALHEPRHGVDGADGAGVGEGDRRALEVLDGELAGAGLADEVLVGAPEVDEVHRLGALDARHEQLPGAVGLGHVDGEAEVDVGRLDEGGLAVALGEAVVHLRHRAQRLDEGVADEVGEGDLAAAGAGQVVVDDDAVVDEQLGGDGPHARGGGDVERGLHVGDDPGGRAAQGRHLGLVGDVDVLDGGHVARRRAGSRARPRFGRSGLRRGAGLLTDGAFGRSGRRWSGGLGRGSGGLGAGLAAGGAFCGLGGVAATRPLEAPAAGAGAAALRRCGGRRRCCPAPWRAGRGRVLRRVVREELPPARVHGALVREVLLVEIVHEPLVRAEGGQRVVGPGGPGVSHGRNASFTHVSDDGRAGGLRTSRNAPLRHDRRPAPHANTGVQSRPAPFSPQTR